MPRPPQLASGKKITLGAGLSWTVAAVVCAVFFWLLSDIVTQGIAPLSWDFLTTAPENAGRRGGIAPILVSTGLILAVCLSVSLPIGLGTAILLAEFTTEESLFGRLTRRSLDVLAGVPSIVLGLFGNAFFSTLLGLRFSILSGGLTLDCMVLPIFIRSAEAGLRSVPNEDRAAAAALGLTQSACLRHILLPSAAPALLAGLLLGCGRALAETAALIFTSGYVDRMPDSLLDSGRALSIHIYDLSMNVPGGDQNAYGSALVLIILVLIINGVSTSVASRWHRRLA